MPITYHKPGGGGSSSHPHIHLNGGMRPIQIPAPDGFAARKNYGKGQVVYLSDAADFSRQGLGHCFSRPWTAARARYDTVFLLLRDVLGIAPRERRLYGILD